MKKYYWLKLDRNFFKRHDIRIIEDMPNGKEYVLFFMKLLVESIDHEGRLRFNELIPYNDQMLATITNTNIDIVRSAIKVFQSLNLLQIWDDQTIYVNDTAKMLGAETEWAKKKRDYKSRINLDTKMLTNLPKNYPYKLGSCTVLSGERIQLPNGTSRFVDEKRYGGNGMIALARSEGKCESCGSEDNTIIHHSNGYSNELEDLEILCSKCHGLAHTRKKSSLSPNNVRQEKEIEKEIELDIDKDRPKKRVHKFTPPTLEEVSSYCLERKNNINPQYFIDYQQAREWVLSNGKKMKDWKATIRYWEQNNFSKPQSKVVEIPTYYNQTDDESEKQEALRKLREME